MKSAIMLYQVVFIREAFKIQIPAIKADNLSRKFGNITAVDDVSFNIDGGEIFGFLGPNGAGKTTTINMLCTLLKPTTGSASINGYDCLTQSSEVRSSIGLVFQDTTLDKDLTARENLVFHAYLYSVKKSLIKERVDEALRFVELTDRANDLVKKFSGGMKRRLEVARGLIHRPKVLFLDEPTLGLDPQSRANLWEFITQLPKKHGVTVFMTTHYMEEAEVCDNIAIIDEGKIIATGSPAELKNSVGSEVVYLKTKDNHKALGVLEADPSHKPDICGKEICIKAKEGEALIPELVRTLGDTVLSVRLERPTLNDVFLSLTGKAIRDEEVAPGGLKSDYREFKRRQK